MREKGSTTQQVMRGNLAPYRVPRGGWIDKGIWGCLSSLHSREQAPKFGHYSGGEFGMSGLLKTPSEISGMQENGANLFSKHRSDQWYG